MSELEPVWCVGHEHGWCATAYGRQFGEKSLSVKTLCDCRITRPLGSDRRIPDCPQCIDKLRRRAKRKAANVPNEKQGVLW